MLPSIKIKLWHCFYMHDVIIRIFIVFYPPFLKMQGFALSNFHKQINFESAKPRIFKIWFLSPKKGQHFSNIDGI